MQTNKRHLLLADDDLDDCLFFKEALEELSISASLTTVSDGVCLMHPFPALRFLDPNMPRINGFECTAEINKERTLRHVPWLFIQPCLTTGRAKNYTIMEHDRHSMATRISKPEECFLKIDGTYFSGQQG